MPSMSIGRSTPAIWRAESNNAATFQLIGRLGEDLDEIHLAFTAFGALSNPRRRQDLKLPALPRRRHRRRPRQVLKICQPRLRRERKYSSACEAMWAV